MDDLFGAPVAPAPEKTSKPTARVQSLAPRHEDLPPVRYAGEPYGEDEHPPTLARIDDPIPPAFRWPDPPPPPNAKPAEVADWLGNEAARLDQSLNDYMTHISSLKSVPQLACTGHQQGAYRFYWLVRALRMLEKSARRAAGDQA